MREVNAFTGLVAPLNRANVDTDAIMPKQFLKSIKRTGYGQYLFDAWRYLDKGEPGIDCSQRQLNSEFILNQESYCNAEILLTQDNFGCGSSREHAPWGLIEYGFKAIIAPSFAEIFYNNSIKNGLLLIELSQDKINSLFEMCDKNKKFSLQLDLEKQTVVNQDDNINYSFEIDLADKIKLLQGLDDIGLTLQRKDQIKKFEKRRQAACPWYFLEITLCQK